VYSCQVPPIQDRTLRAEAHAGASQGSGVWPFAALALAGCSPLTNVRGVFLEGWMVCVFVGLFGAYAVVQWLGRREDRLGLAGSGLFFLGLAACIGLATWWVFQSGIL
jgi:hypothetical protein